MKKVSRLALAFVASSLACSGSAQDAPDAAPNDATSSPRDGSIQDAAEGDSDAGALDSSSPADAPSADDGNFEIADAMLVDAVADAHSHYADAGDAGNVFDAAVPDGSCLLKYNSDVHFDGSAKGTTGTECCYAAGGPNACDLAGRCGPASGGGCCIVYSTPADGFPSSCCHYENSINPPGDPLCNTIFDAGH